MWSSHRKQTKGFLGLMHVHRVLQEIMMSGTGEHSVHKAGLAVMCPQI